MLLGAGNIAHHQRIDRSCLEEQKEQMANTHQQSEKATHHPGAVDAVVDMKHRSSSFEKEELVLELHEPAQGAYPISQLQQQVWQRRPHPAGRKSAFVVAVVEEQEQEQRFFSKPHVDHKLQAHHQHLPW